jgi:hypothetical protein
MLQPTDPYYLPPFPAPPPEPDSAFKQFMRGFQHEERGATQSHIEFLIEMVQASARQIATSEAARAGLLGDVDFADDIESINENFCKAEELQLVADKLAALEEPSADDLQIIAEANATIDKLWSVAWQRMHLIRKCEEEVQLIDKSLRDERQAAKTAEQRAELHGKLSGLLYGIDATADATPVDTEADMVIARVQAYREIKNQIQLGRD